MFTAHGTVSDFSSDNQWRVPLGIQIIPAGILGALILLFPESPRWLMDHDRHQEALQTLAKLHSNNDLNDTWVLAEYEQIKSTIQDEKENGDLSKNSAEIKKLLNNPDLHKVFPGMDYTPLNVQYPYCIHDPPSQNNITRDVAVLSQLTNKIRLYGTDCNQTQMLIHAIEQLDLKNDIKIWLGVWQDDNSTTNARQLDQMWDILDEYGENNIPIFEIVIR